MNLDQTIAEIEDEITLLNDAVVALQRLQGRKATKRKGGRKGGTLGNKAGRGKSKPKKVAGRTLAIASLIKNNPGWTQDEILSKSGTTAERNVNGATLRYGLAHGYWKRTRGKYFLTGYQV